MNPERAVRSVRWMLVAGSLLVGACGGSEEPIKIGLLGPVTNNDGMPMHNAALLAIETINRAGGVRGRPLELVERDDYGSVDSALRAAADLERSGVVAVIGSVYSSITLAVAPIFNGAAEPVVQISPSSSSPAISEAGPYTFRVCPSDLAHGSALARFARQQLNLDRAAILYQNDDYGRGMRTSFAREFARLGGQVVVMDPYLQDRGIPVAYLERMVSRDLPQLVFVAGMAEAGGSAIRTARQMGLTAPFMGGDGLSDLANTDAGAEGTYISVAYLEDFASPANQEFVRLYHERFPDSAPLNQSGAGTWDAIHLLRDLMEAVGTDRAQLRDALAEVGSRRPAFQGLTGPIAFDENGDVPERPVVVGVVRGGELQAVNR